MVFSVFAFIGSFALALVTLAALLVAYVYTVGIKNKPGPVASYNDDDVEGEKGHRSVRQGFSSKALRDIPKPDAIIIGSGIGGLTTAAMLSRTGWKVLVLEQHDVLGGCTHAFEDHGYLFDTGLHYIGAGMMNKKNSSRKMMDALTDYRLEWAPMDDEYDVAVFGDERFGMPSGVSRLKAKLNKEFPHESAAIDEYFRLLFDAHKSATWHVLFKLMPRWMMSFSGPLLRKWNKYAGKTVEEVLKPVVKDPKLYAVLTYLYGDYGLPPCRASFVIHAMTAHHYLRGACYPIGGAEMIARHAVKVIESAGGRALVRAKVSSLIMETVNGKTRCVGVRMKNDIEIRSPVIVSAASAAVTFLRLMPKEHVPAEILKSLSGPEPEMPQSTSHLSLFVGMKGDPKELELPAANFWVFPSMDHNKNSLQFKNDMTLESPFMGQFISFPSAKDPKWPSMYPGKSTCLIVTEAGPYEAYQAWENGRVKHRGADYDEMKAKLSQRLLDKLFEMFPQIRGRVDFTELGTPLSNNFYLGTHRGASYGLDTNPNRFLSDWARPTTPIPGLYLSGQDVISPGVCGALAGGFFAACAVSKKCMVQHISLL